MVRRSGVIGCSMAWGYWNTMFFNGKAEFSPRTGDAVHDFFDNDLTPPPPPAPLLSRADYPYYECDHDVCSDCGQVIQDCSESEHEEEHCRK